MNEAMLIDLVCAVGLVVGFLVIGFLIVRPHRKREKCPALMQCHECGYLWSRNPEPPATIKDKTIEVCPQCSSRKISVLFKESR
jgi:hypothetical protein